MNICHQTEVGELQTWYTHNAFDVYRQKNFLQAEIILLLQFFVCWRLLRESLFVWCEKLQRDILNSQLTSSTFRLFELTKLEQTDRSLLCCLVST